MRSDRGPPPAQRTADDARQEAAAVGPEARHDRLGRRFGVDLALAPYAPLDEPGSLREATRLAHRPGRVLVDDRFRGIVPRRMGGLRRRIGATGYRSYRGPIVRSSVQSGCGLSGRILIR